MTGNSSHGPEAGSPLWLAQSLNRLCDRVAAVFLRCAGSKLLLCMSAFLVGAIFLLPSFYFLFVSRAAYAAAFGMFANFLLALPALSALLFLTGGLPRAAVWKLTEMPLGVLFTFVFAFLLNRLWYGSYDFVSISLEYGFIILALWLVMHVARDWRWSPRLALFLFLLVTAYFYPSSPPGHDGTVFRGTDFAFEILIFTAPFVVAQGLLGERGIGARAAIAYALSPLQFIYQTLPIPLAQLTSVESDVERAAGLLNLLGGFTLVVFCSLTSRLLPPAGPLQLSAAFFWRGWLNYLLYYVGFLGSLHVGVGIGRWLGYRLAAPADQALLAANLVDRWKRWDVYFYWFYLTFVWLPAVRRTGSLLLATMLVFLVSFLWHNVMPINHFLFMELKRPIWPELLRQLAFFCGHGLVLAAAFYYQARLPADSRRSGWGGVLLCHLQMAVLYAII